MPDDATRIDSLLKDQLYTYRYVTFLQQPQVPRGLAAFGCASSRSRPPALRPSFTSGCSTVHLSRVATTSTLSLLNVDTTRVGTYTVVVTTTAGSADERSGDPHAFPARPTRVSNISTRGVTNGGAQVLTGGFRRCQSGWRARQPDPPDVDSRRRPDPSPARPFNVTGTVANPVLEVFNAAGQPILTNDNWGTQKNANAAANTTAVAGHSGRRDSRRRLCPSRRNSPDAAILATLRARAATRCKPAVRTPAPPVVVLIEVYDATPTAATATSPQGLQRRHPRRGRHQ